MRKKVVLIVLLSISSFFAVTVTSFATDPVKLIIDGKEIYFSETDGKPYIDASGRMQMPIRKAMESIGVQVSYDNADKSVLLAKGDTTIKLTIGSDRAVVSEGVLFLGAEVSVANGRSYIPARLLFERFGYAVHWDASDRIIALTASSGSEPVELVWMEPSHFMLPVGAYGSPYPLGVYLNLPIFREDMTSSDFGERFSGSVISVINKSHDFAIMLEGNCIELQLFELVESTENLIIKGEFATYMGEVPTSSAISAQILIENTVLKPGRYKIKYVLEKLFIYKNMKSNEIYANYLGEVLGYGGKEEEVFNIVPG